MVLSMTLSLPPEDMDSVTFPLAIDGRDTAPGLAWAPLLSVRHDPQIQQGNLFIPGLEDLIEVTVDRLSMATSLGTLSPQQFPDSDSGIGQARIRLVYPDPHENRSTYWTFSEISMWDTDVPNHIDWEYSPPLRSPCPMLFNRPCRVGAKSGSKDPFQNSNIYTVNTGPAWSPLIGWVYLEPYGRNSARFDVYCSQEGSGERVTAEDFVLGNVAHVWGGDQYDDFLSRIDFYNRPFIPVVTFLGP